MNSNEKRWIILLIAVVVIAIVLIVVLPRVSNNEGEVVKISIIGENGEVLSTTKPIIGKMDPGETVQINATITADVSNAKNFTIEAVE